MKRLKVALLFGGRSAEHEVSLQSARNVLAALDVTRYEPVLIAISKQGEWFLYENGILLQSSEDPENVRLAGNSRAIALTGNGPSGSLIDLANGRDLGRLDIVFPVLHGPYGEDGTIQALAKMANLPCVGAGILGSAVGMDKDVMKRLLRDAQIPVGRFVTLTRNNRWKVSYKQLCDQWGSVLYVKPCNLGSSVGISKVRNDREYDAALDMAFRYDLKAIVEEEVRGREIECAVMGNDEPIASVPGEVIVQADFYSYNAKYIDGGGSRTEIPANLPADLVEKVRETAVDAFQALDCKGMARVDVFVTEDEKVIVNEINTIPGFTNISMYPKMWEVSGISQTELVSRLIEFALDDFRARQTLKETF